MNPDAPGGSPPVERIAGPQENSDDGHAEIQLQIPDRLKLPDLDEAFEGSVVLPDGILERPATPSSDRPDPKDLGTVRETQTMFEAIVGQARNEHELFVRFVSAAGHRAIESYAQLEEGTVSLVADVDRGLDSSLADAEARVERAVSGGLQTVALSVGRAHRLVFAAAEHARRLIKVNADSAGDQVTAIVNQLAANYTDLLAEIAVDIVDTGTAAVAAVRNFTITGAALIPIVDEPIENAMNEGRRKEVPKCFRQIAVIEAKRDTEAKKFRAQIPVVRNQFNQSAFGEQLAARKSQIGSKGKTAVDKAVASAIALLRDHARQARNSLQEMGTNARGILAAERRAARAGITGDANALLTASHGETTAALSGLGAAAKAGLPAFANVVKGIESSLRKAGQAGAQPLVQTAAASTADARIRLPDIASTQRGRLTISEADTASGLASRDITTRAQIETARDNSAKRLQRATSESEQSIIGVATSQDAAFSKVAGGVSQAAAQWIEPLAKSFATEIAKTRKHQADARDPGSFFHWAQEQNAKKTQFLNGVINDYLTPATAFVPVLDAAASRVTTDLDERLKRLVHALDYGIIDTVDEAGVTSALRGITEIQGRALGAKFQNDQHRNLNFVLTSSLDGDDLIAARNYLAGNVAAGAAAELRASIHWYNDEEARIEEVMREVTPTELAELKRSDEGTAALATVRDNLGGTDLNVFDALSAGNRDRADAYKMQERMEEARRDADVDAVHTILADFSTPSKDRGAAEENADDPEGAADKRRTGVQRELAFILGGGKASADPSKITSEQATIAVKAFVLAPMTVGHPGAEGGGQTITLEIAGANRDLATALIEKGEGSVEARAARLGVEMQRPDGAKIVNLDTALVDPRLNPTEAVSTEDRAKARVDRDAVIQRFATVYGGSNQAGSAEAARDFAEARLRAAFGSDKLSADIAVNLVREEHPSPATAAMAIRLAARGAGTDEDLMWRFVERMDRKQVQAMRAEFKSQTGGKSLDDELGTFGQKGFGKELSGDERLRMERALLGQPHNDRERAEVAAFADQQQRAETGSVGAWLAGDSMQERSLSSSEGRLNKALGGVVLKVDDEGNPVWKGPDGRPVDPATKLFDKDGMYRGKGADLEEFRSAVRMTKFSAENYATKVDSYANFAANAVAVIGAIVATVVTAGGAGPFLAAALAAGTGLASMAVRNSISGGRYGWEQAATDLGMTAVQALTAGVGQQLTAISRGAALTGTMGKITGSAFGDLVLIGAATGGLGGLGSAAISEETWNKGIGTGLGRLFEGGLTGAFSGAATSAVSHAFGELRLGKATSEGRESLGKMMGDSTNPLARGILRGTSGAVGAASGRATEHGIGALTGRYKGDAGDALLSIGEAAGMSALQDSVGGAIEAPLHRRQLARDRHEADLVAAHPTGPEASHTLQHPTGELTATKLAAPATSEPAAPAFHPASPEAGPPFQGIASELASPAPARDAGPVGHAPTSEQIEHAVTPKSTPHGPAPEVSLAPPGPAPLPIGFAHSHTPDLAIHAAAAPGPSLSLPLDGTAAAVGNRFRGDYLERPQRSSVGNQVEATTKRLVGPDGPFGGSIHPVAAGKYPPYEAEFTIHGPSGPIEIKVAVGTLEKVNGEVPVARFHKDSESHAFIIEVSERANTRDVERALAHELAEIRAMHSGSAAGKDALARGGSSTNLSPHDEGRLAEVGVLSHQLGLAESHGDVAGAIRLRDDAEQLAAHLGLVGSTDAAKARAKLALRSLPDGTSRKLLQDAIDHAATNPFLQPRTAQFEHDLPILAGQLELARAMGDSALVERIYQDARLLLVGSGVVRQRRKDATTIARPRIEKAAASATEAGRQLLGVAEKRALRNPQLSFEDRRELGVQRRPDLGFEARYSQDPAPHPELKLSGQAVSVIEDRRILNVRERDLAQAQLKLSAANSPAEMALKKEIARCDQQIILASEGLGMAAGRRFAEQQLQLPSSAGVMFGHQGQGVPDLVYEVAGRLVIIECKGGSSGLGVRLNMDRTALVQQGTLEYLQSLAKTMSKSRSPEKKALGKRLRAELAKSPPKIEYYHVSQPIDPITKRSSVPLVGTFDISGKK